MAAGAVLGQIAAPLVGGIMGDLFGDANSAEQFDRTKQLQDRQGEWQKKLAENQYKIDMQKWEATGYGAQKDQMIAAGLNPGLMYGMGGGGGQSSASSSGGSVGMGDAPNGAAQTGNAIQGAMMATQAAQAAATIELTKAQTEKVKAEANAIPTQVAKTTAETGSIEFQNAVNKAFGIENASQLKRFEWNMKGIDFEQRNLEWEAKKSRDYKGRAADDPEAPLNKQMQAVMDKTQVDLEAAKLANDATKATNVVKEFEAEMARNGISPNTPWYAKFVVDLLEKIGMNPLKMIQ